LSFSLLEIEIYSKGHLYIRSVNHI